MYQGKHVKKSNRSFKWNRSVLLLASLVLMVTGTIGATLAYFTDDTPEVVNTFTPTEVTCEVKETLDGVTKKDVYVENNCVVDSYIRATYVANWIDGDGNVVATVPEGYGYEVDIPNTNENPKWVEHTDGYYYYTAVVKANDNNENTNDDQTGIFITEATATIPKGGDLHLKLDILAEAIQAEPDDAVKEAWGFVPGA